MSTLIRSFSDGSYLEYAKGSFDDWCVYYVNNSTRKPPKDVDYFNDLVSLAKHYGFVNVYEDYVSIYQITEKELNNDVFFHIEKISKKYDDNALEVNKIFSILYMGMIAEERKKYTKLGKRIKRLGMYKLLIEKKDVYEAANFMRGMGWRDIAALCEERGF